MKTLSEAISKMEKGAGGSLKKHLNAAGINAWDDITRESLYDLCDELAASVAPSSAKTILAWFKSLLSRYQDSIGLPQGWQKILVARGDKPEKTYLTEEELALFAGVEPHTAKQVMVQNLFLICAYTGLRISDASKLTTRNIVDGVLHFTAKKTKKAGAIPLKRGLETRIAWVEKHQHLASVTPKYYIDTVRSIARQAGINSPVVVKKAGEERKGPKWMFITSHTARVSTATCLSRRGVPIEDICALLQHSDTAMTERYIVRECVELSQTAMQFFV